MEPGRGCHGVRGEGGGTIHARGSTTTRGTAACGMKSGASCHRIPFRHRLRAVGATRRARDSGGEVRLCARPETAAFQGEILSSKRAIPSPWGSRRPGLPAGCGSAGGSGGHAPTKLLALPLRGQPDARFRPSHDRLHRCRRPVPDQRHRHADRGRPGREHHLGGSAWPPGRSRRVSRSPPGPTP